MTRTAATTPSPPTAGNDLDAWLLGEPELAPEAVTVLAAYREAADAVRKSTPAVPTTEPEPSTPAAEGSPDAPAGRGQPVVLRLRTVDGIDADRLAGVHGSLLAAGYLTAEVLGRAEGLGYRITREGLRRLAGETAEPEAEAA